MNTKSQRRENVEATDPMAELTRLEDDVMAVLRAFDHLSPEEVAKVKGLAAMLSSRADIAPGYVRTPDGGFVPETYEQRERRRDQAEAEAGVLAEIVTDDSSSPFVPLVRRARILSSKLRVNVERLGDPEVTDEQKQKIGRAIDLAWTAFDNLRGDTKIFLELLEHVEVCASGAAPAAEVIRGFQREYPREASKLNVAEVQKLLSVWKPPLGHPSGQARKNGDANKWELFRKLCRSAGVQTPGALTLKRTWERYRPAWLKSPRK